MCFRQPKRTAIVIIKSIYLRFMEVPQTPLFIGEDGLGTEINNKLLYH